MATELRGRALRVDQHVPSDKPMRLALGLSVLVRRAPAGRCDYDAAEVSISRAQQGRWRSAETPGVRGPLENSNSAQRNIRHRAFSQTPGKKMQRCQLPDRPRPSPNADFG
jgi:hypothetical protein